ncbi:glycosyltransferase [Geodermatophilus sp. CPCC 205761]
MISTLGRPRELARCLDAILSGTRVPSEVVVVDQGDVRATATILAARRSAGVPLVHVTQSRRGLAASQNAGVARAECAVVAIVDDDCVPDARWVEVAAAEHARTPGPLLVTGRVLPLPPSGDRVLPLSSRTSTARVTFPPDAMPWDIGTGGNFSVTRTAYLQIGGNDERLGTGTPGRAGNDIDLFHRLMRAGTRALFEPDLLVFHERATPSEHRARRWSYGFGVGVCVGSWLSDGDQSSLTVLRGWLTMRARLILRARRPQTVVAETRVLLGTVHGLWHGWRIGGVVVQQST